MQTEEVIHHVHARPKTCRGCGKSLPSFQHMQHEARCRRDHVQPGMRFHIRTETTVGGQANARKAYHIIEAEVLRRDGRGFVVRSLHSGREIRIADARRFIEWGDFAPGLQKPAPDPARPLLRREKLQAIWSVWQAAPARLAKRIWAASDGYGEPGWTPPQGCDWSGIRDSTDAAVDAMYRIAAGAGRAS